MIETVDIFANMSSQFSKLARIAEKQRKVFNTLANLSYELVVEEVEATEEEIKQGKAVVQEFFNSLSAGTNEDAA